jgi:OCT family organic cation transporter-like MFS transporter 4/5
MAIENFWALGMCILSLLAYLIRDWKYLQLAISVPAVLTVVFFW